MKPSRRPVRVVSLLGDLLGTYGDGGNALVLVRRAEWRGIDAEVAEIRATDPIPDDGHIYVMGGGEDGPQTRAAQLLGASGALHRAVDRGAAVLAVCAGFQIVGRSFAGPDGTPTGGLELLDVVSDRSTGPRIVGEVVADADPDLDLGRLTGYENHAGVTRLGAGVRPFGTVRVGTGNSSAGDRGEGAWQGRVIGTYLHGPVLARNPALADRLLAWALDCAPAELEALDDEKITALRAERFANAAAERERSAGHGPLTRFGRSGVSRGFL